MRAFLAIELPPAVRSELVKVQQELASAQADVKWVAEAHLHVTMRFLGEITQEQRQTIERLLENAAGHTSPIQVGLSHIGAFPSSSSPRVIWVGIGQGKDELTRFAAQLEEGLAALSIHQEDREFVAHVTLGRVRSSRHRARLARRLGETVWKPPPPCWIDSVTLFESLLSSAGPTYRPLVRSPFKTREPSDASTKSPAS